MVHPRSRSRAAIAALAIVAMSALSACGGGGGTTDTENSAASFSGEKRAAAQPIEDFSAAVAGGDWSRICDELFTHDQAELTAGIVGGTCESELAKSFADSRQLNLTVERVQTSGPGVGHGTDAVVFSSDDAGNHQSFDLVHEGDSWRINGYGGTFGAD